MKRLRFFFKSFILLLATACISLEAFERHIGVISNHDFRGETSFAYRIKAACKNIHWQADVIDIRNPKELEKSKYDFVVNLVPGEYKHPKCKNYLAIFDPVHHYFNRKGGVRKKYRSYDGYLLTYSPDSSRDEFPYLRWYPTAQRKEHQKTEPSHLFHICCHWGNRLEDERFRLLLSLLDKKPYTQFYGSPKFKALYPQSYQGEISYDDDSLHEVAAQAGITLVLHSSVHNDTGLPSGRIFEAAAASTVIICDQNSFVKDHFGDSVLYINTDEDGSSIFNQIQSHMDWIRANKAEALEKAKKANIIFKEKFSLEDQLLQLGEFHDQLSIIKRTPLCFLDCFPSICSN